MRLPRTRADRRTGLPDRALDAEGGALDRLLGAANAPGNGNTDPNLAAFLAITLALSRLGSPFFSSFSSRFFSSDMVSRAFQKMVQEWPKFLSL